MIQKPSLSRSPNLRHKNLDLFDTIKELRRPPSRPNTGWVNVVDSSGNNPNAPTQLPAGDPGVLNASTATGFTPVFQDPWVNIQSTIYPPCGFYQSEDGEVRFRGAITGGAAGSVVYTLPLGYRPDLNTRIVCPTGVAGVTSTFEISTNGDVTFIG